MLGGWEGSGAWGPEVHQGGGGGGGGGRSGHNMNEPYVRDRRMGLPGWIWASLD